MQIAMPIVTSVWRRSCPSMRRNTATCRTRPSSAAASAAAAKASSQDPVSEATT